MKLTTQKRNKKFFYVYLATVDSTPMESNTTNMHVASNHPSDISRISETQMTPIDTSKIKTEPSKKFNLSYDIIVIDSDSEDSILNFLPETPSFSTEKTITPPNTENVPETPPSDDDQNNDTELR